MYAWKSNPHGLGADRYPGESPDRADRDWREERVFRNRYRDLVPVAVASMSAMVLAEN